MTDKNENYTDINEEDLISALILRIKELDACAKNSPDDFEKSKSVMNQLLSYIEKEFSFECMVDIIRLVYEEQGRPIGILNKNMTKKLIKAGWILDKDTKELRPLNDEELIQLFQ
jgi:hypothetical protein